MRLVALLGKRNSGFVAVRTGKKRTGEMTMARV